MKLWFLILAPTFLLITAPDIQAHNLVAVNGNDQGHQHVYRRQQYGKPLQQGHLNQAPGGGSMILWRSGTRSDYGKLNSGRNGPVIYDRKPKTGVLSIGGNKYGSPVYGYGKSARNN